MKRSSVAVSLALLAGVAAAQTMYRCGNTYSQVACADARIVDTPAPPTPARIAEARRDAERAKQLADAMERDRLRREASIKPALAASLSPAKTPATPPAAGAKLPRKKRSRAELDERRDFVAAVPGSKTRR